VRVFNHKRNLKNKNLGKAKENKEAAESERENGTLGDLGSEGAGGGELFADEIASGDVGDSKEVGEAGRVGALSDAGAAEEHPLDVSVLGAVAQREGILGEQRRRFEVSSGIWCRARRERPDCGGGDGGDRRRGCGSPQAARHSHRQVKF
jgi:hypothetical protein